MEWGWIIIAGLAILGAGLIAGGVVSYLGSSRVGVKAFGASAVAAGVVMWATVLLVVPASASGGAPEPAVVVEMIAS